MFFMLLCAFLQTVGVSQMKLGAICRPGEWEGHHWVLAIKDQAIACPKGLIANLHGPIEIRWHGKGFSTCSRVYKQIAMLPCPSSKKEGDVRFSIKMRGWQESGGGGDSVKRRGGIL